MANARIVNTPNQAIPARTASHTQITVSSSAVHVSAEYAIPSTATHVLVQVTGANVRITFDGTTAPTASKGYRLISDATVYWTPQMWNAAQIIREGSTDAVLEVQALNFL